MKEDNGDYVALETVQYKSRRYITTTLRTVEDAKLKHRDER